MIRFSSVVHHHFRGEAHRSRPRALFSFSFPAARSNAHRNTSTAGGAWKNNMPARDTRMTTTNKDRHHRMTFSSEEKRFLDNFEKGFADFEKRLDKFEGNVTSRLSSHEKYGFAIFFVVFSSCGFAVQRIRNTIKNCGSLVREDLANLSKNIDNLSGNLSEDIANLRGNLREDIHELKVLILADNNNNNNNNNNYGDDNDNMPK